MARDLETVIRISGNLDASLRRVIEQAAENIEKLNEAAKQSAGAVDGLSDTISDQSKELKQAQKEYANYILRGEESSEQAQELADRIKSLSKELRTNKSTLAAAERAAQQLAESYDDTSDAAQASARAVDALADTIDGQSDELKKAKKQYAAYVLSGEKSSAQAKELARKIKSLSSELSDNRTRMRGAEDAADRLAGALDDVGDAAKGTDGGFTVMKGAIADFVSDSAQKLIDWGANAVSSIYGLADSTREFRGDMASLTTAFDAAGFSADAAEVTWTDLYAVLGEDDRAVEAANNIARMADSQEELDRWTRITTGVLGTYQDALPVESLAEAAGETAKTGTVTGTLADALNWSSEAAAMFSDYMGGDVVTAEDAFNVALSKCSDEAERQALITDTLTSLYGDAADKYNETAGGLLDANRAQAEYNLNLAEMGKRIEPVTSAVRAGITRILNKVLDLTEGVDFDAWAEKVSGAFDWINATAIPAVLNLKDNVVDLASNGLAWLQKNANWLIPVVGGLTAGFAAYKAITLATSAASKAAAIAEGVKTAVLASGATTITAATVATWAFNSAVAFLTSPITIAVAAIAALTAGVIWLYQNWDTARLKLEEFGAKVNEIWTNISGWITGAIDRIGQYFPVFSGYLSGWWKSIQDVVGNVQNIFGGLIDFIGNVFAGNWSAAWQNITDIFGNIFGMIGNIAKAPINGVVGAVNAVIDGINSVGFTIPDWVPVVGGKAFSINIPKIPMLAKGGFTDGVSIAGEAGTEAVISFDRAVRAENLSYWAQAGRLLGATAEDGGFALSGEPSGSTTIDMGGVTFAPNIEINGKADKESVIKAIQDEYPEFLDMLEGWLLERGVTVFG